MIQGLRFVRNVWCCCCGLLAAGTMDAAAENWPGWRGPRGDGSSMETKAPTVWDGTTGKNLVWKTALAGTGHSSPTIWHDQIFLVGCLEASGERYLACLDRAQGRELWRRIVLTAPLESKHSLNSYASGTPSTDGERVYVTFLEPENRLIPAPNVGAPRDITPGRMFVAAYDLHGKLIWETRPGPFVSAHGYCSCPVLFEDLVIVNGDHDGQSYVVALDRDSGATRWKFARKHQTRSYCTPIIREAAGKTQLVFSGSKCITSLNPRDGTPHWEIDGPTEQFVASLVYDGQLFFMTAGFPDYHVMGIKPDGAGNVTETSVAWHSTAAKCYVPSPVVLNGYLIVADDRGTANCFRAADGELLWKERLGSHFSASLVHANGLAYLIADNGLTKVIKPGPTLEVVAENPLGENCYSSPALSDGRLFIRGEQHLFCIGE